VLREVAGRAALECGVPEIAISRAALPNTFADPSTSFAQVQPGIVNAEAWLVEGAGE